MTEETENKQLDTVDVIRLMQLLPHRYPFLLIDRIEEIDGDDRAVGIKCVTINEPFFQGHFPTFPVMPGVLLVEAMAQTAGAIVVHNMGDVGDKRVFFMTVDKCRFRQPVTPGDRLAIEVTKLRARAPVWKYKGVVRVGDKVCAEAEFSAMITEGEDA